MFGVTVLTSGDYGCKALQEVLWNGLPTSQVIFTTYCNVVARLLLIGKRRRQIDSHNCTQEFEHVLRTVCLLCSASTLSNKLHANPITPVGKHAQHNKTLQRHFLSQRSVAAFRGGTLNKNKRSLTPCTSRAKSQTSTPGPLQGSCQGARARCLSF